MLAVNRSSRGLTRIENLSRRQSCISLTLPYIYAKSSASNEKKAPDRGLFNGALRLAELRHIYYKS
jgi:hypothetical protein